jgi:tRNA threonylcarbamoyladenosine biosynthesis protein TsaB
MNRFLLAIDTTAGTSVALLAGETVLAEVHFDSGMKHAELIGSAISQVMKEANAKPTQVTAVAVGRGPALFTGLRVGIAAGIMFSEACASGLVGVVSHHAIAVQLYTENPQLLEKPLLVTTDARRGEVYWCLYSGLDSAGVPIVLRGPSVEKHAHIVELLTDSYPDFNERTGGATAAWVGRLAQREILEGKHNTDVSAMYLRAPDAAEPKPNQFFAAAPVTAGGAK